LATKPKQAGCLGQLVPGLAPEKLAIWLATRLARWIVVPCRPREPRSFVRSLAPRWRSRAVSRARSASPSTVAVAVVVERDGGRSLSTCWPGRRRHLLLISGRLRRRDPRRSTIDDLSTMIPVRPSFLARECPRPRLTTTPSTLDVIPDRTSLPRGPPRESFQGRSCVNALRHRRDVTLPFLLLRRLPIHRTRPPAGRPTAATRDEIMAGRADIIARTSRPPPPSSSFVGRRRGGGGAGRGRKNVYRYVGKSLPVRM
jgi:hypothetical protein